jgi:hypothetical protein
MIQFQDNRVLLIIANNQCSYIKVFDISWGKFW